MGWWSDFLSIFSTDEELTRMGKKKKGKGHDAGGGSGGNSSGSGPLDPSAWHFAYSKNEPKLQAGDGGFFFELGQGAEIDYLLTKPGALKGAKQITIALTLSVPGGAMIRPTDGGIPGITFVMQRKGDDLTGVGKFADYRLWAGGYRIAMGAVPGSYIVTIPIVRDVFTGVNGQKPTSSGWDGMMAEIASAGLTFGATFFGHGWQCKNGTARISVTLWDAS